MHFDYVGKKEFRQKDNKRQTKINNQEHKVLVDYEINNITDDFFLYIKYPNPYLENWIAIIEDFAAHCWCTPQLSLQKVVNILQMALGRTLKKGIK